MVPLPVPVRSRVVIATAPAVSQLELFVNEYNRFGVLLADRQRARMFVFEMGDTTHLDRVLNAVRRIDTVYDVYRVSAG